jgi:hypothetical protein
MMVYAVEEGNKLAMVPDFEVAARAAPDRLPALKAICLIR